MKKLTDEQLEIHKSLLGFQCSDKLDDNTRIAVGSATCAFLNSINHGTRVTLIEADELKQDLRKIDPNNSKLY